MVGFPAELILSRIASNKVKVFFRYYRNPCTCTLVKRKRSSYFLREMYAHVCVCVCVYANKPFYLSYSTYDYHGFSVLQLLQTGNQADQLIQLLQRHSVVQHSAQTQNT